MTWYLVSLYVHSLNSVSFLIVISSKPFCFGQLIAQRLWNNWIWTRDPRHICYHANIHCCVILDKQWSFLRYVTIVRKIPVKKIGAHKLQEVLCVCIGRRLVEKWAIDVLYNIVKDHLHNRSTKSPSNFLESTSIHTDKHKIQTKAYNQAFP